MSKHPPDTQRKSAERLAFEIFLRTGRRLISPRTTEQKFNPYHDPRNGQFTFAPGGPKSIADPIFSDRRGLWRPTLNPGATETTGPVEKPVSPAATNQDRQPAPDEVPPGPFQLASRGRPPRRGRGSNGGRPTDPLLLDEVFPGLAKSPAGTVVRAMDAVLDLSTAANDLTRAIQRAEVRRLVAQIQSIDPEYRFETLGEPETLEGQANQLRALRFDRAVAMYRVKGEVGPMQVEVFHVMQQTADRAYADAVDLFGRGELRPRLNRGEAIGNYVDRAVKRELEDRLNFSGIDYSRGQPIRVQGREYISSGTDRTYRRPDARVGNIALDATIREKSLNDEQVQGFFDGDFEPDFVIHREADSIGWQLSHKEANVKCTRS